MSINLSVLLNFAALQLGWLGCVTAAANGLPWAGTLLILALLAAHLWQAPAPAPEVKLILATGALGFLLDSLQVTLGLLRFPSGTLVDGTAPYWIVSLWMQFGSALNFSLRWLKRRYLLAALFGATGGPLAFYAGHRLGGVTFFDPPWLSLAVLALVWAGAMPLLVRWSLRWDGNRPRAMALSTPASPA